MAFEEYEPKHIHTYTPDQPESIRVALKQYVEWVLTGEAFMDDYCVVIFKPEVENILLSDFEAYPSIHTFLQEQLMNCEPQENIIENLLTETLLFACALKYPELKEEIVNTCRAFVTYARALNDSAKMWITCEEPFAFNPLLMTAYVYPEYGYLLTAFYVPYWDDEHMQGPLYPIFDWAIKIGVTPDTIKAFCYCDNAMARELMLGYSSYDGSGECRTINNNFNLMAWLRESDENYLLFKDILAERYKEMPYMPYTEDSDISVSNPIADLVLNMMYVVYPYDTWDDDNFDVDEYFTQPFIQKAAEEEIPEITSYIEEKLGKPLVDINVFTYYKSLLKYDPNKYKQRETVKNTEDNPFTNWKDFIVNAIPDGEDVWAYISEGTNKEILSSIEKTKIFNLIRIGRYELYREIEEECYNMESMWEELHNILKQLFKKSMIWGIKNSISPHHNNQLFLRLLDVLFMLRNQTPFTEQTKSLFCNYMRCTSNEEFTKRYASPWFNLLENELHQFGSNRDNISKKNMDEFTAIIYDNYQEAIAILPEKLFNLDEPEYTEDNFESFMDKKYGTVEISIVAACILKQNQDNDNHDALTDAAKNYLNKYTNGLLFYNLLEGCKFPRPDWLNSIKKGHTNNISDQLLEDYEEIKEPLDKLEQFIYSGYIKSENHTYSSWESERMTLEILDKYLEDDRDEISDHQKQYDWLSSSRESVQKLLYVAHLASDIKGLNCSDTSVRILKLAFHYAPVKTCKLLIKAYTYDYYDLVEVEKLISFLDKFKKQGLSSSGNWAYLMQVFIDEKEYKKDKFLKSILTAWSKKSSSHISDTFTCHIEEKQRKALHLGYQLLPWNHQLKVLDYAVEELNSTPLKSNYDTLLIQRILRELSKNIVLWDVPVYFKNRLQEEGYFCEFVENNWDDYPDITEKLLKIQVDKPIDIQDSDFLTQLQGDFERKYIIVQKQGEALIPICGHNDIWLIQQSATNGEKYNLGYTKLIIIDETCPKENLEELYTYLQSDYTQYVLKQTEVYLNDANTFNNAEVENIFRYGVYNYRFMRHENFYEIDLEDIITKVSWPLKSKTLKLLGLVSAECLNIRLNLTPNAYYELLLACDVNKQSILKYLLQKEQLIQIQHLSRKTDFSKLIDKEKLADQMVILSCIAPIPEYHPLILKFEDHKSAKIRKHVLALKEKFRITAFQPEQFLITDYGVYIMQGNTDPEAGSSNKTAQEPVCINQTENIKAELGMFIGFRFSAVNPASVPKVIVHKVKIEHPAYVPNTNQIRYNTMEWTQNGYANSKIFLGCHFENKQELVPGEYKIIALDMNGNLIAEKTFNVEIE